MALVENFNLHFGFIGVLVAAVVYFFLGGVWYSQKLFGPYHMKHHHEGTDPAQMKCGTSSLIGEFILDLIMAYVLAIFINFAGGKNWSDGLLVGLWVWIGFVATTQLSAVIWAKKSVMSFFVTAGFVLVGLLVMGSIIGLFKSF